MLLTIEELKNLPAFDYFATGTIKNSPDEIYMTNNDQGRELLWVAQRGGFHDWAIYIHWADKGLEYVKSNGDKVTNDKDIRKLVSATEEAYSMYRK